MSFAFCFDKESDVYEFCYCYPYTYSTLQNYLDLMDKNEYSHYKRELLGTTLVREQFFELVKSSCSCGCKLHTVRRTRVYFSVSSALCQLN